jgi:hypothetical protein
VGILNKKTLPKNIYTPDFYFALCSLSFRIANYCVLMGSILKGRQALVAYFCQP